MSNRIYEVFGYRTEDESKEAQLARATATCPFMNAECDGGGNRYSSAIRLTESHPLHHLYPNRQRLNVGVCSLHVSDPPAPWIVCPRRLLALGREDHKESERQREVKSKLAQYLGLKTGERVRVWKEVKLKLRRETGDTSRALSFDYTFDYVAARVGRAPIEQVASTVGLNTRETQKLLQRNGYTIALIDGVSYAEDFVTEAPIVIEVMTSSTSGGNQDKGTRISDAFVAAILRKEHRAPGINYRQVWARMASQLIVKSQAANGWGGFTVWVVQDVLVDYIRRSTALDIDRLLSYVIDEVNVLSFGFPRSDSVKNGGLVELEAGRLYSGPALTSSADGMPVFADIISTPLRPNRSEIVSALLKKGSGALWVIS